MSSPSAIDIFKSSRVSSVDWNTLSGSESYDGAKFQDESFLEYIFAQRRMLKIKFSNCHFDTCAFMEAEIEGSDFLECRFTNCDFLNVKIGRGSSLEKCNFIECRGLSYLLKNCVPQEANFEKCTVGALLLNGIKFHSWIFHSCHVAQLNVQNSYVGKLVFSDPPGSSEKSTYAAIDFHGGTVDEIQVNETIVKQLVFHDSCRVIKLSATNSSIAHLDINSKASVNIHGFELRIHDSAMNGCTVVFKMNRGSMSNVNAINSVCSRSYFEYCGMVGCSFLNSRLFKAKILHGHLDRVDFSGARLQSSTIDCENIGNEVIFTSAQTEGLTMTKHTLESLGDSYGNLTKGQRMKMNIVDNVESLRLSFSGFYQLIHIISLSLFIFPYVMFMIQISVINKYLARYDNGFDYVPVWKAFYHYVLSAGQLDGTTKVGYVFIFAGMLLYNCIRVVLLFQTKKIELQQECAGLPRIISLDPKLYFDHHGLNWIGFVYHMYKILFIVNIFMAALHVIFFINTPVFINFTK